MLDTIGTLLGNIKDNVLKYKDVYLGTPDSIVYQHMSKYYFKYLGITKPETSWSRVIMLDDNSNNPIVAVIDMLLKYCIYLATENLNMEEKVITSKVENLAKEAIKHNIIGKNIPLFITSLTKQKEKYLEIVTNKDKYIIETSAYNLEYEYVNLPDPFNKKLCLNKHGTAKSIKRLMPTVLELKEIYKLFTVAYKYNITSQMLKDIGKQLEDNKDLVDGAITAYRETLDAYNNIIDLIFNHIKMVDRIDKD